MHNRYYARTTRNAIRALRNTTDKEAATALLPKVSSMIDKLAKINVIHKNKAVTFLVTDIEKTSRTLTGSFFVL